MKKLLISLLVCAMMIGGCNKKVDYTSAIDQLKQQYASDTVLTQTLTSFFDGALAKAKEYGNIDNIGFMVNDSFDSIQTYVSEHKDTVKYMSFGIGAIVIIGGTAILVVKTAMIAAVLTLIANKVKDNDKIQLAVNSFESLLDGKKENEESTDLKQSLQDGFVIMLNGANS